MHWFRCRFYALLFALTFAVVVVVGRCSAHTDRFDAAFQLPPRLDATPSRHEDNWAVIVSSSKYWHNFRQSSDAFALYQQLRANGFPDEKIVLFVSENHACDKRNPELGHAPCSSETNYPNRSFFGANVAIDFEGYNADAHGFLRVLYGAQAPGHRTPSGSKQLRSTRASNVLVFIASHSGEFFTKFQDYEFLSAHQLSHAFQEMHRLGKYNRLLFVADTCKASTLFEMIDAPNIVSLTSSGPTDDGRNHRAHFNSRIAVHAFDAMSSELFDFVAQDQLQQKQRAPATLRQLFRGLKKNAHIDTNVSVSHVEHWFHQQQEQDVLDSGAWLVNDFFVQKSRPREPEPPTRNFFESRLDGDFVFWKHA